MKTGVVMEGGAMRGMFTAGIIDVFLERNVTFDGAIGVSAGATFGCNLKSKQQGRAIRYNCNLSNEYKYGSFRSWLETGDLYDVEFCYHKLVDELDPWDAKTFVENPMDFWVVAANVETGEAEYHKLSDGGRHDIEWIRASASIPICSRIVEVDGLKLLDGGIADSVPLQFFESLGYDRNLVILTQPDVYRKKKNKATPICRFMYRKYPKFVEIFANRHFRYNANIDYIRQQEKEGKIFVIRPDEKLDVKPAEKNPDKLRAVYEIGRQAALKAIDEDGLIQWLNQ